MRRGALRWKVDSSFPPLPYQDGPMCVWETECVRRSLPGGLALAKRAILNDKKKPPLAMDSSQPSRITCAIISLCKVAGSCVECCYGNVMDCVVGWSFVIKVEAACLWAAVPGVGVVRVPSNVDFIRGLDSNMTYVYELNCPVVLAMRHTKVIGICKPSELEIGEAVVEWVDGTDAVGFSAQRRARVSFSLAFIASELRLPPLPVKPPYSSFIQAGLNQGTPILFAGVQIGWHRKSKTKVFQAITVARAGSGMGREWRNFQWPSYSPRTRLRPHALPFMALPNFASLVAPQPTYPAPFQPLDTKSPTTSDRPQRPQKPPVKVAQECVSDQHNFTPGFGNERTRHIPQASSKAFT